MKNNKDQKNNINKSYFAILIAAIGGFLVFIFSFFSNKNSKVKTDSKEDTDSQKDIIKSTTDSPPNYSKPPPTTITPIFKEFNRNTTTQKNTVSKEDMIQSSKNITKNLSTKNLEDNITTNTIQIPKNKKSIENNITLKQDLPIKSFQTNTTNYVKTTLKTTTEPILNIDDDIYQTIKYDIIDYSNSKSKGHFELEDTRNMLLQVIKRNDIDILVTGLNNDFFNRTVVQKVLKEQKGSNSIWKKDKVTEALKHQEEKFQQHLLKTKEDDQNKNLNENSFLLSEKMKTALQNQDIEKMKTAYNNENTAILDNYYLNNKMSKEMRKYIGEQIKDHKGEISLKLFDFLIKHTKRFKTHFPKKQIKDLLEELIRNDNKDSILQGFKKNFFSAKLLYRDIILNNLDLTGYLIKNKVFHSTANPKELLTILVQKYKKNINYIDSIIIGFQNKYFTQDMFNKIKLDYHQNLVKKLIQKKYLQYTEALLQQLIEDDGCYTLIYSAFRGRKFTQDMFKNIVGGKEILLQLLIRYDSHHDYDGMIYKALKDEYFTQDMFLVGKKFLQGKEILFQLLIENGDEDIILTGFKKGDFTQEMFKDIKLHVKNKNLVNKLIEKGYLKDKAALLQSFIDSNDYDDMILKGFAKRDFTQDMFKNIVGSINIGLKSDFFSKYFFSKYITNDVNNKLSLKNKILDSNNKIILSFIKNNIISKQDIIDKIEERKKDHNENQNSSDKENDLEIVLHQLDMMEELFKKIKSDIPNIKTILLKYTREVLSYSMIIPLEQQNSSSKISVLKCMDAISKFMADIPLLGKIINILFKYMKNNKKFINTQESEFYKGELSKYISTAFENIDKLLLKSILVKQSSKFDENKLSNMYTTFEYIDKLLLKDISSDSPKYTEDISSDSLGLHH